MGENLGAITDPPAPAQLRAPLERALKPDARQELNPLWVARPHGHTVRTMLEVYAAWAEGSVESDVAAIRRAMEFAVGDVQSPRRGLFRRLVRRWLPEATLEQSASKSFSVWHWIWHQERATCT